jgi:SAM-dependent methyltransferase
MGSRERNGSPKASFNPAEYWEGRLRRDFSLCGVGYVGLGQPYNDWLYRVRKRVFRRIVSLIDVDFPRAEVLDIGSGTGFYIERWKEAGVRRVTGVDLTQVAVEALRRRFPEDTFVQADIARAGLTGSPPGAPDRDQLRPGSYDVISAFDILFHIVDDRGYERAIGNIASLLRPGGWFVFSENFLRGPAVRAPHVVSRSQGEITDLLEAHGLHLHRRGPMFVLMNYPVDTASGLPRALWSALTLPLRVNRRLGQVTGFLLGAALYPFELLLTAGLREGPSTEFALCRKAGD